MNTDHIRSEASMLLADHGGVGSLKRILPDEAARILEGDETIVPVLWMFVSHTIRSASGGAECLIVSDFQGNLITSRTYSV